MALADRRRDDHVTGAGGAGDAVENLLEAAAAVEVPPGRLCLDLARAYLRAGDERSSAAWLLRIADDPTSFLPWQAGASLLPRVAASVEPPPVRSARIGIVGTYTTSQLVPMIRLAARRFGIETEIFEGGYAQYEQELLDPKSALYAFAPDHVVIVAHEGALHLPDLAEDPASAVASEVARWTHLWRLAREGLGARVIQHAFVVRPDAPFGHLGARLRGSRDAMVHGINRLLGEEAGSDVLIVDCERLASLAGKWNWFDDRYWHLAKQAVALDSLPLLARHTAAVLAADLGLSRKCVVLDLDDTLWGGTIGEDGLDGIAVGGDAEGEAFLAFQRALLRLKSRGVILAVCSKNNPDEARLPFERHPEMLLRLEDFAAFEAGWEPKPDAVRRIAQELGIGVDSIVYVDDNPAEREALRRELPEVDVLALPTDPSGYVRALAEYPLLESAYYSGEDARRTEQYRVRSRLKAEEATATDLPSFWRSLEMRAEVLPIDSVRLPRAAQLIAKTNQFNLTSRRHSIEALKTIVSSQEWVHVCASLSDRFSDHGVVAVALARQNGSALEIDTLLMSCRVIGRTLERTLLAELSTRAKARGCSVLRGLLVPTERNAPARGLYPQNGFELVRERPDGAVEWEYDLEAGGAISNDYITVVSP